MTLPFRNVIKTLAIAGGAVAQLGARLDGIEEVEGSNPFGSTNPICYMVVVSFDSQATENLVKMGSENRLNYIPNCF